MTNVEENKGNLIASPGKAMTLRLDLATWRQLKLRALDEGRPAHDLIVKALRQYLNATGE